MNEGVALCIDVDADRIRRRVEHRYLDEVADSLDDGVARVRAAASEGRALSVAVLGNAAEIVPELSKKRESFDLVTDQTAAHDPLTGYVPAGLSVEEAASLRGSDPDEYLLRARASIAAHVEGMLEFVRAGSYVLDYGNNLRGEAYEGGVAEAFSYPGFVPAYIRPLFCRGVGPFRWAALSGDPADIAAIDDELRRLFPGDALGCELEPALEQRVVGEEPPELLVDRRDVGRVAREDRPPEGTDAVAEEGPDIGRDEARV